MNKRTGYYIVYMKSGQQWRVRADNSNQAINIVVDKYKADYRHDFIDAMPEYMEV